MKNSYDENLYYLKKVKEGDADAEVKLMEINMGLVNGLAHRFKGRGVDFEDLCQIGSIGMLKAIRSFDLSRGTAFSTYAVPLIIGEIRRFLRDDGLIKVSRNQKRLGARLMHQREIYIRENGVEPTLAHLAELAEVSVEEAAVAMECSSPVHSLSEPIGDDDLLLENVLPSG
ncbi:MAG: sigma-70 family RNA polymerase sigma factor, partial [Ruminococcaceae bacterium]|nr:sigma-70 family RNA polymerase sigma factor [Oscillospiraceae bacterium]